MVNRAREELRHLSENPALLRRLLKDIEEQGYASHSWQYIKRRIADPAVQCILKVLRECGLDCIETVFLADLTGAEHSYIQGHGGKDLDIILYAPGCSELDGEAERLIESTLDEASRLAISETLGFDPVEKLGIPNVIEVHIVRSKDDVPYWNMIFSGYSRLIRVWERPRLQEIEE